MRSSRRTLRRFLSLREGLTSPSFSDQLKTFEPYVSFDEAAPPKTRERVYTLVQTCWLFLFQVLHLDMACLEVVEAARSALGKAGHKKLPSTNTSAYCQARQRIPDSWLVTASRRIAECMERKTPAAWKILGRNVKLVDGSTADMPDTEANRKKYPYGAGVIPGCGFPLVRLLAVFSLATGLMDRRVHASYSVSERALFRQLIEEFLPGDVWLADRGFCGYAEFWMATRRRVDVVARKHQTLGPGLSEYLRLGKGDRLCLWTRPRKPAAGADLAAWTTEYPETQWVREATFQIGQPGLRTQTVTILTTLLDPNDYPAESLALLYRSRWQVELRLRELKGPLGLDHLRCKSPDMIEKEIHMHGLACNLIRAVMTDAAARDGGLTPDRISFKGGKDAIAQWSSKIGEAVSTERQSELFDQLLDTIAQLAIPDRPNRYEPRCKKRRSNGYPYLTKPRDQYRREAMPVVA